MDKNIGKVVLLNLPDVKRPRYRWIVRKREDGRYIVRAPKTGVLIRELNLKRDSDYTNETLLPINSKICNTLNKTKSTKHKYKTKTKTKKNKK